MNVKGARLISKQPRFGCCEFVLIIWTMEEKEGVSLDTSKLGVSLLALSEEREEKRNL